MCITKTKSTSLCHLTDNVQDFIPGCDLCGRPEGDCGDGGKEDVAEVGGQGLEGQEEQGEEVPRLQRRLLHDRDNVTSKDPHSVLICAVRENVGYLISGHDQTCGQGGGWSLNWVKAIRTSGESARRRGGSVHFAARVFI